MAVLGDTYLNIADKLKRQTPDGERIATVIELLSETNEVMNDMITLEGNTNTGHRTTMRTGLPDVTFRRIYGFTQPTKSKTAQVDETCGTMEAYSVLDKQLANLNGDVSALRLSEDEAFMQAMNQRFVQTLFYGNTDTDPEEFLGLAPRFSDLSADNGSQIIDAGGTGADNTSLWLVKWSENTCHGIYPKGTMAGLQHNDDGVVTETDGNGGKRKVYQSQYIWSVGLAVRDYRHVARIANIDVSDLNTNSGADLINLMIDATYTIENTTGGRLAFYANRDVHAALTKMAVNKSNVQLSFENFGGSPVLSFQGIPVRRVDGLLSTESQVT